MSRLGINLLNNLFPFLMKYFYLFPDFGSFNKRKQDNLISAARFVNLALLWLLYNFENYNLGAFQIIDLKTLIIHFRPYF